MNLESLFAKLEEIGTMLAAIAFTGYVFYKTFSARLEKWVKDERTGVSKTIGKQSEIDCEIVQEAEKLKEIIAADRVQVFEFHNGVHYANGRSALRMSCTYEVCRYGIEPCLNKMAGVPLTVVPNLIKALLDKDKIVIEDIDDVMNNMPSTYNLLCSMGVKSFYAYVIHNNNGEPVGFVALQFCREKTTKIQKDNIQRFVWFIESKLSEM